MSNFKIVPKEIIEEETHAITPKIKKIKIAIENFKNRQLSEPVLDTGEISKEFERNKTLKNSPGGIIEGNSPAAKTFFRFKSRKSEIRNEKQGTFLEFHVPNQPRLSFHETNLNKPVFGFPFNPVNINNIDIAKNEETKEPKINDLTPENDIVERSEYLSPNSCFPLKSPRFGRTNSQRSNSRMSSLQSKGSLIEDDESITNLQSPINHPKSKRQSTTQYDLLGFISTVASQKKSKLKEEYGVSYFLFFPDDRVKTAWDIIVTIIILMGAVTIPFQCSFSPTYYDSQYIANLVLSLILAIDLFFSFFTSFFDEGYNLIINRNIICKHYLTTWFALDFICLLSICSSNLKTDSQDKLIIQLFFLLRLFKERFKFGIYMDEIFKVGAAGKRFIYYGLGFILMSHWTACLWYGNARIEDLNPNTWVVRDGYQDLSISEIYMVSLYWAIQTITTVGYGNIAAGTFNERLISIVVMCIGVCSYSFAVGSITSVFATMDTRETVFQKKLSQIEALRKEFGFSHEIYIKLKKAVRYEVDNQHAFDKASFLNELPHALKIEVSMFMHRHIVQNIEFFRNKSPHFLAYVGPYLKSHKVDKGEYIYSMGDPIDNIYFIVRGKAAFVLKDSSNMPFVYIDQGAYFGESEFYSGDVGQGKRAFTVRALEDVELLSLNKFDLAEVDAEFPEIVNDLFKNAEVRFEKTLHIQEEAQECAKKAIIPRKSILALGGNLPARSNIRRKTLIVRDTENQLTFQSNLRDIDEKISEESPSNPTNTIITEESSCLTSSFTSGSSFEEMKGEESLESKTNNQKVHKVSKRSSQTSLHSIRKSSGSPCPHSPTQDTFTFTPNSINRSSLSSPLTCITNPKNWNEVKQGLIRKGSIAGRMQELNKRFCQSPMRPIDDTQFHQITSKIGSLEEYMQIICKVLTGQKNGRTKSILHMPSSPNRYNKSRASTGSVTIINKLAQIPDKSLWAERKLNSAEDISISPQLRVRTNKSDNEGGNRRKLQVSDPLKTPPPRRKTRELHLDLEEEEKEFHLLGRRDSENQTEGNWMTYEEITERNTPMDINSDRQLIIEPPSATYTKSKFATGGTERPNNISLTHSDSIVS